MSDETRIYGPGAHPLHRWISNGQPWACAAYDHGPMCRLCTPVSPEDETTIAILDNVDAGLMEAMTQPDGELRFRLTPKGEERVRLMLEANHRAN